MKKLNVGDQVAKKDAHPTARWQGVIQSEGKQGVVFVDWKMRGNGTTVEKPLKTWTPTAMLEVISPALTPDENRLLDQLPDRGSTPFIFVIKAVKKLPLPMKVRELFATVISQAGDNPGLMSGILGFDILQDPIAKEYNQIFDAK